MNRLTINSKYENRYLLTEEISFDPKTGNQVWAVIDSETGKRLFGRFNESGKVEWFDDTRPKSTNNSKKVEQNKPLIVVPSSKSTTNNNEKTTAFVIPAGNNKTKRVEKSEPFSIPQINRKSSVSTTIKSFESPKTGNEPKIKGKTKLPLYIGLSLLGLCLALIGYDRREFVISKINQPKVLEVKVDSTVNVINEKEVVAPPPNLPKIDTVQLTEKIVDTLKLSAELEVKVKELENNNPPKKVNKKQIRKTPKRLDTIKF